MALERRTFLCIALGAAASAGFGGSAVAITADGGAKQFMEAIAKDLFAAAKNGSSDAFLNVITRYADIRAIAQYCVGNYAARFAPQMTKRLNKGVAQFMAHYFADQAEKYRVVSAEIKEERPYDEESVVVGSRIYLASGSSYSVDWLLAPQGRRYKVRDVRVLGFWLSPFQRRLFTNHIDKNGGDVRALLAALRV